MTRINFSKQVAIAGQKFVASVPFLIQHKVLWKYFLYPILLGVLFYLFNAGAESGIDSMDKGQDWEWSLGVLWKIFAWILMPLAWVAKQFMNFFILIMMIPILAIVSEKVEEILTGQQYPFDFGQLVKDIFRGLAIAFVHVIIYYIILLLVKLFTWFLPEMVGKAAAFILGAYFYGYAFIDYVLERRKLSIGSSMAFGYKHLGLCMVFGALFQAFMTLDIVGVIVAPILLTIAATLSLHSIINLKTPHGR